MQIVVQRFRLQGNLQRMKIWNQWHYLQNFLLLILTPTRSCRETCCKMMNMNSDNFLTTRNCPNCASTPVGRLLKKGQFFITLDEEGQDGMKNLCREYTLPRSEEASRVRGWILRNTKTGPVLDVNVCLHQKRYGRLPVSRQDSFLRSNCEWN